MYGMFRWVTMFVLLLGLCLTGCTKQEDTEEKVRDLDFTVVEERELPQTLREIIMQKKEDPFKLSYSDGGYMYLVVGYGEQPTGGYSIEVPSLYLTETMVVMDANLIGPQGDAIEKKSYPYIAIKTELIDLPVMFR